MKCEVSQLHGFVPCNREATKVVTKPAKSRTTSFHVCEKCAELSHFEGWNKHTMAAKQKKA